MTDCFETTILLSPNNYVDLEPSNGWIRNQQPIDHGQYHFSKFTKNVLDKLKRLAFHRYFIECGIV